MFSVRRSKIHGRGCFAAKTLRAGTEFHVPSWLHSDEAVSDRDVWVDDEVYSLFSPFMFLNHADSPNAELCFDGEDFNLYLLRTVEKGQELTIDYGEDWHGQD